MKRYEKVEKIISNIEKKHKQLFGWSGQDRDGHTNYMFLTEPEQCNYDEWKEKRDGLKKAIRFFNYFEQKIRELRKIGCEDSVRWLKRDFNVTLHKDENVLYYGIRYRYLNKVLSNEFNCRKIDIDEFEKMDIVEKICIIREAFKKELDATTEHIKWLEEEIS